MLIFGIVLTVIVVLAVGFILFLRHAGGGKFPWVQFYLKGKESGFTLREVNLLRKIAVENRMKDPTSLFWSIKQLDRCIKGTIINYRSQGGEETTEAVTMVSKLFDFRKRVEFNQPKYSLGLKNSRNIDIRQRIKVILPKMSPFSSTVIEILRKYIAIAYPQGPELPSGFLWKGQQIGVNFWREGDAGYFFQSRVLEDYTEGKKYPILHITHNDNVVRTQKRNSVRVKTSIPTKLYPLKSVDEASEEFEMGKGLKSLMSDLSEDGTALLIGGRAKVGLPVKYQFHITEDEVVVCGVVRGVNFDQKRNRSLLHIQALPVSNRVRNIIRAYVYNLFGERKTRSETKQPTSKKPH